LCCITFSGIIAPEGDAKAAGVEALRAVAYKSVEKNIVRISHENGHDAVGHKHTG